MPARGSARDLLVTTTAELIYRRGVGASGVDTITRESGVSKPTLYAHFRSKNELVEAALRWRHRQRREETEVWLDGVETTGVDKVLAVFDWVAEANLAAGARGCAFVNAAVELVDDEDEPARATIRAHKAWWQDVFADLVREAGAADVDDLSAELVLLLDGVLSRVLVEGTREPLAAAKRLAALAIRARLESTR
jgi:AcrR family transcriptional regulator